MKKALITLVILIIIGFIPFQHQGNITLKANYFDVCQQLRLPANWLKWEPESSVSLLNRKPQSTVAAVGFLIHTPDYIFNVTNISANVVKVIVTANYINYEQFYTVVPGLKNNITAVVIDYKINAFKWLFSQFQKRTPINDLKVFMENAQLYYGFTIKEIQTDEVYMVVKKETVLAKNRYSVISKAAKNLNSFIAQNHLKATQELSGSYYPQKNDSLQILIGMPVNKPGIPANDVIFMRMPGGKVVVGSYKGKYSERQKIYTSMEKYIQDHYLQKQVAPFETYLNNRLPANDNDVVDMQINYPVL